MGVKVRERPKGSGIFWIFMDHNGKRKAKKIGTNEKLAHETAKKLEAKLILGDVGVMKDEKQVPTFKEYSELWLDTYGATAFKHSTLEDCQRELKNHLLPAFGKKRLDEITKADVKQFIYQKLKAGLSGKTVRKYLSYLSGIFSHAIDDEIISANPTEKLSKLTPKKDVKADLNPLNKEEIHVFLEKVRELYPRYYPFFLCAARTGMRLGELIGLEWGHIDFFGRFIEVRQSVSRYRLTTPKNKRIRKVDMSQQLTEVLKAHKKALAEEALKRGEPMTQWVFTQANGKRVTTSMIGTKVFHRCLDRAGLRHVRFHDLRHSFASILIQQGESLAYVKEQMGHHSIKMTVDLYAHLAPEGNKSAVDRLDDVQDSGGKRDYPQPIRNRRKKVIGITGKNKEESRVENPAFASKVW